MAQKKLFIDLGAERVIAAEKAETKIAVEVKSFVGRSDIADLEFALGQFVLYQTLLAKIHPERTLYLAVHNIAFESVFRKSLGELLIEENYLRLVVFDPLKEEVLQWIP